jgi:hypothetical protein
MIGLAPDPAEPGAVLAALKTKPPAAVARLVGGPVLTAAVRGARRTPGRDGETVLRSNRETGFQNVTVTIANGNRRCPDLASACCR